MPPERKQAIHPADVQNPNSTKSLGLTTPMHTDRQEVIDWSSRFPAAGDWERSTDFVGAGKKDRMTVRISHGKSSSAIAAQRF
jgi:hypothetical protein